MRGKLRDKRVTTRRESFKRDINERRRPGQTKRDHRVLEWLEEDESLDIDIEDESEENSQASTAK